MKKITTFLLATMLILGMTACGSVPVEGGVSSTHGIGDSQAEASSATAAPGEAAVTDTSGLEVDNELDLDLESATIFPILLDGDAITSQGSGARVDGTIVTITAAGFYRISGSLNDGQVRVDTADEEAVVLLLNGANITCLSSAPIYVVNASEAVIFLEEGTENAVRDGSSYDLDTADSGQPNAAIFSNDDLVIGGMGALTVSASYNNGIASDDDLVIAGGRISVTAVNDGIKSSDSLVIRNGIIDITAGADGLQAGKDEQATQGEISIEGGTLIIEAVLDGIQAVTSLEVSGGELGITTGGGSVESGFQWDWGGPAAGGSSDTEPSAKGLKAGTALVIRGGNLNVDSLDDALHSNGTAIISGGTLILASSDDGIHADAALEINGGSVQIWRSYEGLESTTITINNGDIQVTASDDGINVANGNDGSAMLNGWPEGDPFATSGDNGLILGGGSLWVEAGGDGLDINGPIAMTGGVVLINGPTSDANGAVDYLGNFDISGGLLVAVGSAGMAQAPSSTSTQYSVLYNFQNQQAAGSLLHISSTSGEEIVTFLPTKAYQSVLVSTPAIQNGMELGLHTGGSPSGTASNGLYADGVTNPGTQVASLVISSVVTGSAGFGLGGWPGPGGGGHPPRP